MKRYDKIWSGLIDLRVCRVNTCIPFLGFTLLLFLFSDCTNSSNRETRQRKTETPSGSLRKGYKKPVIIDTDTCPKPVVTAIPNGNVVSSRSGSGGYVPKPPDVTKIPVNSMVSTGPNITHRGTHGFGFFTTFTSDDGLALDAVYCSFCDHSGNLWVGTAGGGVSCYDGKSFTNFTHAQGLAGNNVWSITEDNKGNLWFGTSDGGVSRYDGRSFLSFTTAQGLASNNVSCAFEDQAGILWFGTQGSGVSRYNGSAFTGFTTEQGLADNNITSILEDQKGNLWFGTSRGVSCYNGKSFTNFTTDQGLVLNAVSSLCEDQEGNLWCGTDGGGVSRYNGKSFTNFTTAEGLAHNTVWSITADKSGNLWFGTGGGGISGYDGKTFSTFSTSHGLPNNSVRSITVDKTGNLWFCTYGGGISHYDGQSFTNFTTNQGLPKNSVRSICEDQEGNLWFGSRGGGVTRYDGQSFVSFTTAQGLVNNSIYSIAEDSRGNLWFGAKGGLSCYDGKYLVNYSTNQGLSNSNVISIMEDKTGNLWFGTSGDGLYRYDGKCFTNFTTSQGLAGNTVYSICEDKTGHLWFGTFGAGVSRFDGKLFSNYTTDQGLTDNTVWCITPDKKGNLWLGTGEGISMIPEKDILRADNIQFMSFTTNDGLPNSFVTQILQGKDGVIYVGTNLGLCEINLTDEGRYRVGSIYNTETGYPVKDVNVGGKAMYADSKGIIWVGTGSDKTALVRFDPKSVHRSEKTLEPVLHSIKVDNQNICWHDLKSDRDSLTVLNEEFLTFRRQLNATERLVMHNKFGNILFDSVTRFIPLPENLILPHDHNTVAFEFNAIEPTRHFMVRYQYILVGYDKDWNPVTDKTSATYGNMNKGRYTFKVKARSPDGVWSEPVVYQFRVLPPWYLSFLAIIFWGLSATGLIALWVRMRISRVNRRNGEITRELEQRIKERTAELEAANKAKSEFLANMSHEIRTPMNAVLGYADLLGISLEDKTQKEYVDSLKSSGRGLLTLINGILDLSKIEAGKLELEFGYINTEFFFSEFERIFSMKIAEKGLEFILNIASETPAGIYVDENRLRQVLFNLIGNAIKFTENGQINVRISSCNTQFITGGDVEKEGFIDLIIEVEDTGVGISEEFQKEIFNPFTQQGGPQKFGGTGLGLAITKRLISLMRGTISVRSEMDKGTSFRITIPNVAFLRDFETSGTVNQLNTKNIEFGKANVLIADDVVSNRKYLIDALKNTNITISEAEDGEVAYHLAQEIIPDLIISDILMPKMNGFALLDKLKKNDNLKHIPVIAYSASVMKDERDKITKSEFAGLLIKPVLVTELFLALMDYLPYTSLQNPEPDYCGEEYGSNRGIVDLPGLLDSLETGFMDTWKTFAVRQPINEIKEFAKRVISLGINHEASLITGYGEDLASAADSFNIETMLKLIRQYPGIIKDLRKSIHPIEIFFKNVPVSKKSGVH